MVDFFIMGG